jgi:hypothetical protein
VATGDVPRSGSGAHRCSGRSGPMRMPSDHVPSAARSARLAFRVQINPRRRQSSMTASVG